MVRGCAITKFLRADKEDKNLKLERFIKTVNETEDGLGFVMENNMKNLELRFEIVDNG